MQLCKHEKFHEANSTHDGQISTDQSRNLYPVQGGPVLSLEQFKLPRKSYTRLKQQKNKE